VIPNYPRGDTQHHKTREHQLKSQKYQVPYQLNIREHNWLKWSKRHPAKFRFYCTKESWTGQV